MQKLIIYLSTANLAHPLFAAANEETLPDDLQAAAKSKEIIVLVPAEDVLLTQVTLPKLSKSRLTQALPFALEEQLIPDLETLHFAAAACDQENYAVAVIAKEKIQVWCAQLDAWKIKPDKLLPVCLALPFSETQWHVMLHDNIAIARTAAYQGFACERQNLFELLQLAISTTTTMPEEIRIQNYSTQTIAPELRLAVATNETLLPAENFVRDLARGHEQFADLNLLQGNYSQKKGHATPIKKMVYAAGLMLVVWTLPL